MNFEGAKGPFLTQPPPVPPCISNGFCSGVGTTLLPLPPKPLSGLKTAESNALVEVGF